jgi:hypothetical protein
LLVLLRALGASLLWGRRFFPALGSGSPERMIAPPTTRVVIASARLPDWVIMFYLIVNANISNSEALDSNSEALDAGSPRNSTPTGKRHHRTCRAIDAHRCSFPFDVFENSGRQSINSRFPSADRHDGCSVIGCVGRLVADSSAGLPERARVLKDSRRPVVPSTKN